MSDYGRAWESASHGGEGTRKEFELRTLRESVRQYQDALKWLRKHPLVGESLVRMALEAAGYDERAAPR